MQLMSFSAFATTRDVDPGTESTSADGIVQARNRVFTDIVESDDPRVAGINRPRLAIDVDPRDGSGSLSGDFELQLSAGGSWRGVLSGTIVGGLVRAEGLAVGTGPYAACAMRVDFQQVAAHAGQPPCAEPKAFFEMKGQLLSQD
jgi:hypothetical protein